MSDPVRYGRRGGGWHPTRSGDGVCQTCRMVDAAYEARHRERSERWLSCGRCRTQAYKYRLPIDFIPLHQQEDGHGAA